MRGQTSDRETQVNSYMFVDKITTAVTASVYIKYISGFKIIRRYFRQKYHEEKKHFVIDNLKE